MKIKILTFVSRNEIGSLSDLRKDDIISLDNEIADKLIEEGKAEIQI